MSYFTENVASVKMLNKKVSTTALYMSNVTTPAVNATIRFFNMRNIFLSLRILLLATLSIYPETSILGHFSRKTPEIL